MGVEQFGKNQRAINQKQDSLIEGYHFSNLFDQNEDQSGEKRNLATGEPIINDQDEKSAHLLVNRKGRLLKIDKELEKDEVTKFFLDNGFDAYGNEINNKDDKVHKK